MPSSFFTSIQLERLYIQNHLSTYDIAKKIGCDPKTVYYWLKNYNIPPRPRKTIPISKNVLVGLYKSGFSLKDIGKRFDCTPAAVLRKFRKYSIRTRFPWEANRIHPRNNFSGDPQEKAYLIGFRIGDLGVKQATSYSSIIVKSNTTHLVQVKLLKKLFSKYGPVWVSQPKNSPYVHYFTTSLNNSFSFLIPKYSLIPNWIIKSKKLILSFLAGYTDAEGSIRIYTGRASFRIGSYDKGILNQIHELLLSWGIKNSFLLETKAGMHGKIKHNGDFYRVNIRDRNAINLSLTQLLPFLEHENRRHHALIALKNVRDRLK